MEKLTLTPQDTEIVVNNGSADGAVDLFSYGPDMEPAARTLGSLYVVGWRQADTNTMGYVVSLIAALARREYYAQPGADPREAFTRTLRRINEVVDEFFKSSGVELAAGIFAIAGSNIMVSKLDKFKILLAREGQVVDILNNVALFSKEHLEKKQFSSIISGSLQTGDRLLAYHPSKLVTARERSIKGWLLGEDASALAARLTSLGSEHPDFAASFVHVNLTQTVVPQMEEPTLPPATVEHPTPQPSQRPARPAPAAEAATTPTLAWSPRQGAPITSTTLSAASRPVPRQLEHDPDQEVPNIIPTEYAIATRQSSLGRALGNLRFIRLDGRGKAIILGVLALVIAGGTLTARSLWFTSPEEKAAAALLETVSGDLKLAQSKAAGTEQGEARSILVRALATLSGSSELAGNRQAKELSASILATMDTLDNALPVTPSVIAQLDPATDRAVLATWASASASLWAVTRASDNSTSVIQLKDGVITGRTALPADAKPSLLVSWRDGVLAVDTAARAVLRVTGGTVQSYTVPVQEDLLDAAVFDSTLYVLTDKSILKITDLDTNKPVTKRWLTADSDLAAGAARIRVDGNIYTLGRDGVLATYYKGKKTGTVQTPLDPSGNWHIIGTANPDELAVTSTDRMRVYVFSMKDGSLTRTLKLDSEQKLVLMSDGPDGSAIFATEDNRFWKLQ